jgi:REP element-mobilizing transposase RayT
MPDHLHMLVVFAPDKEMKKVVSQWKENTAKRIGIQWQRDFFDHRLRKEESVREKADYALNNPIRKGLVTRIEDWPYVWMPER